MKSVLLASSILVAVALSGNAAANCTTDTVISGGNAITDLIKGSLICGRPGSSYTGPATDRWQEQHRTGGAIYDYKLGPGDAVDPEKQVGTWSTQNGSNTPNYLANYGPSSNFNYTVRRIGAAGNTYSFCLGSSEQVVGNIYAGAGVSGNGCSNGRTYP